MLAGPEVSWYALLHITLSSAALLQLPPQHIHTYENRRKKNSPRITPKLLLLCQFLYQSIILVYIRSIYLYVPVHSSFLNASG